jgi:predicted phosphoribosyltransferase
LDKDALVFEREDIASPKIRGDRIAMDVLTVVVVALPARVLVVNWAMDEAYSTAATTILGRRIKSPTSDEARIAWINTISSISFTDSTDLESHVMSSNEDEKDDIFTVSSRRK